ncbi:MAG: HEAT repeat domain-containing protein, partial [Pirellulales bacterium]
MIRRALPPLAGLFLFLPVLLAGCQSGVWRDLAGEPPDAAPGVTPPAERIEQLDELAAAAGKRSPEQQQKITRRLAEEIVDEDDPMIRARIVRTLASYPTATGREVLQRALRDPDHEVRIAACRAWGRSGTAEAVKLLGRTLQRDADVDVRLAAARALGETGEESAVEPLGKALHDKDPAMQYRAMQSLARVTGEDLNTLGAWRHYIATGRPP